MQNPNLKKAPAASHHTDTPSPWIAIGFIAFVLVLVGVSLPVMYTMATAPNPMVGWAPTRSDFTLQDDHGRPVTDRSWPGKFLLVYFGYTHCPDLCPTTLAAEAQALQMIGAAAETVQPLFITIDPARDTPAVMRAYTALFSPRLLGLVGTPAAIHTAALHYGARYQREPGGTATDYDVSHTGNLYLIAPDGGFLLDIPPEATAPTIARALARILDPQEKARRLITRAG